MRSQSAIAAGFRELWVMAFSETRAPKSGVWVSAAARAVPLSSSGFPFIPTSVTQPDFQLIQETSAGICTPKGIKPTHGRWVQLFFHVTAYSEGLRGIPAISWRHNPGFRAAITGRQNSTRADDGKGYSQPSKGCRAESFPMLLLATLLFVTLLFRNG